MVMRALTGYLRGCVTCIIQLKVELSLNVTLNPHQHFDRNRQLDKNFLLSLGGDHPGVDG